MNNATIITALYNIQRETQGDGRAWSDYLQWFQETLQLPLPMAIYIPKELEPFVHQYRPAHLKTHVVVQELEEIPYAYCEEKIKQVLENPNYQRTVKDPLRVECKLPFYNIIQYSKLQWIKEIATKNPFDSTYFFWMDAGISRFISRDIYARTLDTIHLPSNKVVMQHNYEYFRYPVDNRYLWDSQCLLCGTMFGGDKEAMCNIAEIVDKLLLNFLQENWINNEQILLAYIEKRICPEQFYLILNDSGRHLCLYEKCFI